MAGKIDGTTPETTHSGDGVPEGARTLKVGAADLQLADLRVGDEIILPDGRVLDAEVLLEAIKAGDRFVVIQDGTEISLEDLLIALGLETGVPQLEDEDEPKNQQASFSQGPILKIIQSLIEAGVIDPTELLYRTPEDDDSLTGFELQDNLPDLVWTIAGESSVEEGETSIYTVSYTGTTLHSGQTVTISVGSGAGYDGNLPDAVPGSDYDPLSSTLTFTGGGPTLQTVGVSTIDDTTVEGTEDFIVTIVNPTGGTISTSQADTDILDNDASNLNWSVAGPSAVTEGNTGLYTVSYTGATLAPGQTATITVGSTDLTIGDPDATAGSDYTSLTQVLTFTAGSTSQTVAVSTIQDTIVEGTEDYAVTIGGQSVGNVVTSQADTDILDNDASNLNWSVAGPSAVTEGNTGLYTVSYTGATLAPGQTATITVGSTDLTIGDPDATAGSDYTSLTQVLTFTAGSTSQTVAVSTIQDTIVEGTEDYAVTIGGQSVGNVVTSQADTDILDNDASNLNWSVAGPSAVTEGNTGLYTVSYTGATLAPGQTATITVGSTDLTIGDPDATAGSDYTSLTQVLTFTAGSTSQTVAVSTIQDTIVEGTEDYAVTIGGQSVGNVVTSQADTDILDNDASNLNWSVAGPSAVTEGNTGLYTVSYTGATLAPGQTATITVGSTDLTIGDPDATAGSDYTSLTQVLTFTAGSTSQTVAVSTIQDTIVEGTEDYAVTIGGQSVGNVVTSQADTDILDNDASNLNWSVAGPSAVTEGNTGLYTVSYTGATLAPGQTATITVGSTDLTIGDPDATAGSDYTSLTQVLTFTAGSTSQTVAVSTIQDTIVEGTEDYAVTIGGQSVGNVVTSQADTDILDNDASNLNWSVAGPSAVTEGNTGLYTVSYTGATLAPGQTATITVGSTDLTIGDPDATAGSDYTSLTQVLTFTAGSTSQTVAVSTIQDTIVEGTEDYAVTIGGQSVGNVVTSQADTDILDNDASNLNWSVAGPSAVTEGNTGLYTVSYTGATLAPGQTATITVGSTDLTIGDPDATAGSDYTSLTQVLTFTAGSTSQTVAVSTIQDTIVEGTEDYAVTIGGQSVGNVVTSQADTDILDNDASNLNWSVAGPSAVTEGNTGLYTVSYTGATLAPGQTATITVGSTDLTIGDPDATAGSDYTSLTQVLTFTAGSTSQTVAVSTIQDTIVEGTEDYAVTIGGQSVGNVVTSQADTDILDNDASNLNWSVAGPSAVTEGNTGLYTVSYTGATLAPGQTATITVGSTDLTIGDPDATAGSDYTSLTQVLTFTAGSTSQTVAVSTIQDTIVEGTEDYAVTIGGQSVGNVVTSQADTDILDNDASNLNWSVAGPSAVTEGNTGLYTVSYTGATLAPGQTATITVGSTDLTIGDPDATAGSDYTSLTQVLTFTAGSTSQTVAVSTIQDTIVEGTEDYAVTIGGQNIGNVVTSQADTDILDNDASNLNWSVAGPSAVTEGNTGLYTVSYTGATLAPGQTATITVGSTDLTIGDPDATAGSDYTSLTQVLTFTAGSTSQTVAVSTIQDTIVEGTEDYAVTIGGQSVGNVVTSQADTDILDNDASNLNWSVAGPSAVTEGNTGLYTVSYTGATLAPGQTATITVGSTDLTIGDPDATAGSDYTSLTQVLTFTAGSTSQTVAVSTIQDTIVEGTEDYAVTIGGQSVGNVVTSQADTDILDNDASNLNWSVAGPSAVTEGNTGLYTVSYTGATLAPGQTATITVGSTDLTIGDPDATAGSDYTSLTQVLTFTAGSTSQTVAVSTIQDTIVEGTEDYAVTIGGQSVGNVVTSQADTDILDNDASNLNWSVAGPSAVTEGNTGLYTVSYTGATLAPGQTATITVGSTDLTIGDPDATAGSDYTSLTQVLTFTAGSTSQTVAVSTIQDTIVEGTEDYAVTIGGQNVGDVATSQAGTDIVDDDASNLNWSISGTSEANEGSSGLYTVSYTGVTIAAGQTATISVATGGGFSSTLTDATGGSDYTSLGTVLTFTSGTGTTRTVAVSTVQDTILEGTEDFTVTIGNQSNGSIVTSQTNTVIVDNDSSNLSWSIVGSTSVNEGNTGSYTVSYTGVTLASGQTATITVGTSATGWTSTLSDASAGSDYTALSTVLTFTAGSGTTQTVAVSTIADGLDEPTEDFRVTLAGQSVGTIGTSQANAVIIDENQPPVVAAEQCVWVADATSQMTSPYANGYPLNLAAPTDSDGNTLSISSFTLPAQGAIWYQLGGGGAFTLLVNGHTLTIAELQTLVYRPDNDGVAEESTFTYTVSDGVGGSTVGTVHLHEELQVFVEGPTGTIGSRNANTPLNSGNSVSTSVNATQAIIDALGDDVDGHIKVATDFQIQPNDVPIPVGEQPAALAFLQAQVNVQIQIDGLTFNVVVAGGDNTEYWTYDNNPASSTYGIWVAEVPADQIMNSAAPFQSLETYINANPLTLNEPITVLYTDTTGGNEQARFVEFNFGEGTSTVQGGLFIDGLNTAGCADNPNLIYGTTLGDTLIGGNVSDRLFGREGNDVLSGSAGDDSLDGGDGNDTLKGGTGNDTVLGGAGLRDIIDWSDATSGITHTLVTSAGLTSVAVIGLGTDNYSNIEGMAGGSGADSLTGNTGANLLYGNGGNDTLSGDAGADTIDGGIGNDRINGGAGGDLLLGGEGDDTIVPGAEDASDVIDGGGGFDIVDYSGNAAGDNITSLTLNGSTDATVSISGGNDTLKNAEGIIGTQGNDTITGDSLGNYLKGEAGADSLSGADGSDTLLGDAGNDTLVGGAGTDTMTGGANDDDFRWNTIGEFGDWVTDFATGADDLVFDVGSTGTQIRVGDNDTNVEGYFEGTLAAANIDGRDVIVITDDGITDPLASINGGSFNNINDGTVFVIEDSDLGASGTVGVYYDQDPSTANGAVLVGYISNLTDIDLSTFQTTDFVFV